MPSETLTAIQNPSTDLFLHIIALEGYYDITVPPTVPFQEWHIFLNFPQQSTTTQYRSKRSFPNFDSIFCPAFPIAVGRNSSVGIATRYGLDGPGIESRWRRDFPHPPWGPACLLCNGYRVSFPGVKRPGRGVDHPPSSADVKERAGLYFYSPSGHPWLVIGWNLFHSLAETTLRNLHLFILWCLMTIFSTPSFGGEVKPSVPCRRFAECKRSLNLRGSRNLGKITGQISRPHFHLSLLGSLASLRTCRHLAAKVGTSKGGGKQWQTTPKNLPRMQCARAIPVTWLVSGSCQPGL